VEQETLALVMMAAAILLIMIGFPIAFALGGTAVLVALWEFGPRVLPIFLLRIHSLLQDYILLAIPLFVFMGFMLENTGIATRMYAALRLLMGRLPGGLALATIATGTLFAAATGVVGASVVTLGLVALPAMLKYGYDRGLATGSVAAAGTLGILIPPSILIVVYGPMAGLSVGQLFASTLMPGLFLSAAYLVYALGLCILRPAAGPVLPEEERNVPFARKLGGFVTAAVPTLLLIMAVLGSILAGIAAPTEAAAVGAAVTVLLAAAYRSLSFEVLRNAAMKTLEVTSMIYLVTIGATMFTGLFIRLGGGDVVKDMILDLDVGPYVVLWLMILIVAALGMFLDWLGILLICIPLFTPIAAALGFDPIWFATAMIVSLQLSYLTPPFALALFYLRGIAPPGVTTGDMYRGIVPFVLIQGLTVALLVYWPPLALWLPRLLFP
jgi:tripartite ATP-independent transporter DctM subunit